MMNDCDMEQKAWADEGTPTPPSDAPLVSVVIPAHRRPLLLQRAAESALAQTLSNIEVIVVVDGADPGVADMLRTFQDSRLRTILLPETQGACAARNRGIEAAKGKWIALLDDDDEWHPEKLEAQWAVGESAEIRYPIVTCRANVHTPSTTYVVPRRFPRPGEHISEYLMLRRGLFYGEGLIQTSMIFAPRELLLAVPFTEGLYRHQETDWLLRTACQQGVQVVFVDRILSTWYVEENRPTIGGTNNWQSSVAWALENRDLMVDRAFSALLMTIISNVAAREGDWKACWRLLRISMKQGKPSLTEYVLFGGMWLIPQRVRQGMRNAVLRVLGRAAPAAPGRLADGIR
jgi:glycosyltransferase involved in cell wall biosynthesis